MATEGRRTGLLSLVLVALFAAVAAAQTPTAAAASGRIGPKDQLKITVLGAEIAQGPFTVDGDGTIDYPYLKHITAAGLTPRELGAKISQQLVEEGVLVGSPQVTVELTQTAGRSIFVSGEVASKGEYTFTGETRVFNALVRAGGATADAGDEIIVIRATLPAAPGQPAPDPETLTLSRKAIESGDPSADTILLNGDRVVVQKARQVYIDGQVNRPGGYTVEAGTTLRQALSLAGGSTELGALNRIRILRAGKHVDKIDLDKTIVQPGDTITIPKKFM
jgi:polysaccharide export outer membrane protein